MAAAVHDLCGKQVALIGEADHGDGETLAFKAELVQRLVRHCGFGAVFFEASFYDFTEINRRLRQGEVVDETMLSSSIGGMWNRYTEFRPLVPFLLHEARAGRVVLGGLDDQLGSAGAFYSNEQLPAEFAGYLPAEMRAECREALHRRIYSDYPEAAPYAPPERELLRRCLAGTERGMLATPPTDPSARLQMIDSIRRDLDRDFIDRAAYIPARDRSMYRNFTWLAERLPPRTRIIVWTATSHIAKDTGGIASEYPGGDNFGSFVHRAYGKGAFALGFTAAGGSHRWSRREARELPTATPGSLEQHALARRGDRAAYLGAAALTALGAVPGGPFSHEPVRIRWSTALDGVVIFPRERPQTPL